MTASSRRYTQPLTPEEHALELQEWRDALIYVVNNHGRERAADIVGHLQQALLNTGAVADSRQLNTPYRNTIPVAEQPCYPGDPMLEKRIENIIRWNAMAMVLQAYDSGSGVGGHIATYASAATMLEVGFNHCFRGHDQGGGDLVNVQAHASPGIYARAFLEGRLDEQQLINFRRQLQPGGGLPSYPHPWHMPDFWQAPTGSMGLSTPIAIYQARFAKYLEARGLKARDGSRVWNFIGDGEADEPEVIGTIGIAAREKLDNLTLVINCNLQRLDGPVRGNGKVIQELERSFRGAGWHVIKVVWGSDWDPLLARDHQNALQARMDEVLDGDYQMYSTQSGASQREHWVGDSPVLRELMQRLSDEQIRHMKRGGQDARKIYAAYHRAMNTIRKPTVILVKTVKGDEVGESVQGKNVAHQKKNLSRDERIACGRRFGIPLGDDQLGAAAFYRPDADSDEIRYLLSRRESLGGSVPARHTACPPLPPPEQQTFEPLLRGSDERSLSTTMAAVRLLAALIDDEAVGKYVVPIVPDEARTFGMEALFRKAGIYSPDGQQYRCVDAETLTPYREAADGQILQEGICETGAMASFLAAGTAYANHGIPTIPFYIFYSIFGFQRVGDMIWACADCMTRGFLLGGTAGRTTLNGEGLQHQEGHSHILASTVPNLRSYDPAFGYELAVIVRDGIRAMYADNEQVFYYLTVYNENYPMPALPEQADIEEQILKGMYRLYRDVHAGADQPKAHLFGSGSIMQQVLAARELLREQGISTDVWSVTSYTELYREAQQIERWNRLHPQEPLQSPFVAKLLEQEQGCFIAASDYMKALPQSIAPWIPGDFVALGTDGFGLSESREMLRQYFEVDAVNIAYSAMQSLYRAGKIDLATLENAMRTWRMDPERFA